MLDMLDPNSLQSNVSHITWKVGCHTICWFNLCIQNIQTNIEGHVVHILRCFWNVGKADEIRSFFGTEFSLSQGQNGENLLWSISHNSGYPWRIAVSLSLPSHHWLRPVLRFLLKRLLIRAKHRWMSFSSVLSLHQRPYLSSSFSLASIRVSTAQPPGWAETSSGFYQHTAALALFFYLAVPQMLRISGRLPALYNYDAPQAAGVCWKMWFQLPVCWHTEVPEDFRLANYHSPKTNTLNLKICSRMIKDECWQHLQYSC